jgi:hypothetical protein
MGQTRSNPKYRPKISGKDTPIIAPQIDTKLPAFKKMMEESGGEDDSFVYGCPSVIKMKLGMPTSVPPSTR